ncbi:MAG: hypothetical protein KAQ89_05420 [Planctomycetes bacterium]|nr:hypothetical protein [Planctomycetota bacterium]
MFNNGKIKIVLWVLTGILGTVSVATKQLAEEQVFYDVSFEKSFAVGDYAYNCIRVLNHAWFGLDAEKIVVKFGVFSPNHSKDKPKHEIYIDYCGKNEVIKKDIDGNNFALSFDNKNYKPDVALFTEKEGVKIVPPREMVTVIII